MRLDRLEDLFYDLNESFLKTLKIEEENIKRLQLVCIKQCDWGMYKHYSEK